ncbi:MAG: universal stress protein [Planctomycetes bacterium]|nr:universal stress protein [Planctomycetota bacterium]
MKILIGVDGSASSLDAVRLVARLVDPAADAIAVYFSPLELEKRLPGRPRRIVEGAAAALFEEACSLLPGGFVKPIEMIASSKSAAVGLLESATEWRADIIVVGARGNGSVERFLLGSVSRAVMHGAGLPVLIARGAPSADRGLKVLVCHRPASAGAVAATMSMLHWPAITAGSVIGVTESMLAGPLPAWLEKQVRDPDTAAIALAWQHEHDEEVAAIGGSLATFQATLPLPFRSLAPIVSEGNPAEQILARAKHDGSDLIVVGRTPSDMLTRWLLGSTSEAVLTHAAASVLVIPVEKRA